MKMILSAAAFCAAALCVPTAFATPISYTLTGIGSGSVNGSAFTGAFTFTGAGDTASIDRSSPGYDYHYNLGGSFSEGSFSTPLQSMFLGINEGSDLLILFNTAASNGIGLTSASLAGYKLSTSLAPVGPVTASADLSLTNTGGSFTGAGNTVTITGLSSLAFSAAAVPEPQTWALLLAGCGLIGAVRWRCG